MKPSTRIKEIIADKYHGELIELPYAILDFLDEQVKEEKECCLDCAMQDTAHIPERYCRVNFDCKCHNPAPQSEKEECKHNFIIECRDTGIEGLQCDKCFKLKEGKIPLDEK